MLCGKLGDFSPNLPHNIHFFGLVITYPIFTLIRNLKRKAAHA
jgi:hypothetical protein